MGMFLNVISSQNYAPKLKSEAQYHRFYVYFLNFLTSLKHQDNFFGKNFYLVYVFQDEEHFQHSFKKIREKKFFLDLFLLPCVKMGQNLNFFRFFRNHTRTVLHVNIHRTALKFDRKKLSVVFQTGWKIQKIHVKSGYVRFGQ